MAEGYKRCPYCDEEIRVNAIKCKHCGSFLAEPASAGVIRQTAIREALIARYDILEEIGRGGMGIVYKAIQKNLNRPVALKVLPPQFTSDVEFLRRFHGEARKAAQLNHPNIITIYDEGVEGGVHFIAMEFIDGDDLRNIILRERFLPVKTTLSWIRPLVEGLGYAHRKGLIHRDIKSANILISSENRPVLTDFGIARITTDTQSTRAAEASQLTRPGTIMGTLQYMSPEQITGKPVTPVSDIYSMGVVMYQCLTGELPFRGDTDWSTMHKIANNAPTAPRGIRSDIPKPIETLVLRCMAKDPSQRYQSCEELLAAMDQATAQTPAPSAATKSHGEDDTLADDKTQLAPASVPPPVRSKINTGGLLVAGILVLSALGVLWQLNSSKDSAQEEIARLLQQAELLERDNKLFAPPDSNAFKVYQQVLQRDSLNATAGLRLQQIREEVLQNIHTALAQEDYPTAQNLIQTGLEHFRGDSAFIKLTHWQEIPELIRQAQRYMRRKQYHKAREICEQIQDIDPQDQQALDMLEKISAVYATAPVQQSADSNATRDVSQKSAASASETLPQSILAEPFLGISFVAVAGGQFEMGDASNIGQEDERPAHKVEINSFRMSQHEVTFEQYDAFCEATNRHKPSDNGWGRGRRPVINVSWDDAMAFCQWLSQRTGKEIRLPTEAEWEYAARARGKRIVWPGANSPGELIDYASINSNSNNRTQPVGQKKPNDLGLYDMSGNASEWCLDFYDKKYYGKSAKKNPQGPAQGNQRVLRGGCSRSDPYDSRCTSRSPRSGNRADLLIGFRLVISD